MTRAILLVLLLLLAGPAFAGVSIAQFAVPPALSPASGVAHAATIGTSFPYPCFENTQLAPSPRANGYVNWPASVGNGVTTGTQGTYYCFGAAQTANKGGQLGTMQR